MADLAPHPLVVSAARSLATTVGGALQTSADELDKATARKTSEAEATLATTFANQANLPGLIVIAGYVGGQVDHDGTWRLVYLDSRLDSWVLIEESAIVVSQPLIDPTAPSGRYDVLWVNATANLVRGSGPRTNEGRFLVGDLTRAGDFAASTAGSTLAASSGLLCEATTPGCCITSRTR